MYNEVNHYLRHIKMPEGLRRLTALVSISGFLEGRNFMLTGPVQRLYPNLFILIIAQPGNGKSLMSNVVGDIIRRYNRLYGDLPGMKLNMAPKDINPSSLIMYLNQSDQLKEIIVDGESEPSSPVFIPASELSVLCENTKHGNLLTSLLELYEGLPVFDKITRTNSYERLERCVPTMISGTTPSFWFGALPDNLARDGFAARCLLYYFNEFIERDAEIPWGTRGEFDACVHAAHKLKQMAGQFTLTKGAREYIADDLNKANNDLMREWFGKNDLMMGYANRRMDQVKKIAMCLAAGLRHTHEVCVDDLKGALAHLAYIEDGLPGLLYKKDLKFESHLGPTIERHFENGQRLTFNELLGRLYSGGSYIKLPEITELVQFLLLAGVLKKDEAGRYYKGEV